MTLTKNDLAERMRDSVGITKAEAMGLTEILIEIVKESLRNGEDVLISGFGKFCVKEKAERKGRNPATGGDMMLPARRVVTFKWSGKLRDKINKKR